MAEQDYGRLDVLLELPIKVPGVPPTSVDLCPLEPQQGRAGSVVDVEMCKNYSADIG